MKGCKPSDAAVHRWRDGWELVGQVLDVKLLEPPDRPAGDRAPGGPTR
jgi:hypothetical protein